MADNNEKKALFDRAGMIELFKNTLILLAITLLAGGILGLVYCVTEGPIAKMQQAKIDAAHKTVFETADHFSESILDADKAASLLSQDYSTIEITDVLEAYSADNELLGYVIEVTSHEGFGGDIVFSQGVTISGTINGISITQISETAGLGMKADEVIVPQFKNRYGDEFVVSKTESSMPNEINAISSATITSKAMVRGVNAALLYFREILLGGGSNE